MKTECIALLQKFTGKKYIHFVDRANTAIFSALQLLQKQFNTIYIQDQGGWKTYITYANELQFTIKKLYTDYGIVSEVPLQTLLLINSMPAYIAYQDMNQINPKIIINDISGSIGNEKAMKGDILIQSFGRWKPVSYRGGMVATSNPQFYEHFKDIKEPKLDFAILHHQLLTFHTKVARWHQVHNKIINDLNNMDITHKNKLGINVIIKYKTTTEKQKILNYCTSHKFTYTKCPEYFKINEQAISIEVTRT